MYSQVVQCTGDYYLQQKAHCDKTAEGFRELTEVCSH